MKIRAQDKDAKKYELANLGFNEFDIVEKAINKKFNEDRYQQKMQKRENSDFYRGQKAF